MGVNVNDTIELQAPFGGWKLPGLGRELGREGLMAFRELKHIRLRLRKSKIRSANGGVLAFWEDRIAGSACTSRRLLTSNGRLWATGWSSSGGFRGLALSPSRQRLKRLARLDEGRG